MSQDNYLAAPQPIKVGIIGDNPARFQDPGEKVYNLVREQFEASGRFERGFEFVVRRSFGPPAGPIKNTIDAYNQLCDEGCLVVVGPHHSDSNIAITRHVEARQVPLIALGATASHMSEYTFSIRWGSSPNDAFTCASWLKKQGCKRVCYTWDNAEHSREYVQNFLIAVERAGLRVIGERRFPQVITPALNGIFEEAYGELRDLNPDGIVDFGSSETAFHWASFVNQKGWDLPRIMNDTFFMAYLPGYTEKLEGWCGTTLFDDDNTTLQQLHADYIARYPGEEVPPHELMAIYRDGMLVALEGIKLAPIFTPEGVKEGLEKISLLPAAIGGPRTCIGFAPYDRAGLKGPDLMVVRRVKGGKPIMEGRIELF